MSTNSNDGYQLLWNITMRSEMICDYKCELCGKKGRIAEQILGKATRPDKDGKPTREEMLVMALEATDSINEQILKREEKFKKGKYASFIDAEKCPSCGGYQSWMRHRVQYGTLLFAIAMFGTFLALIIFIITDAIGIDVDNPILLFAFIGAFCAYFLFRIVKEVLKMIQNTRLKRRKNKNLPEISYTRSSVIM